MTQSKRRKSWMGFSVFLALCLGVTLWMVGLQAKEAIDYQYHINGAFQANRGLYLSYVEAQVENAILEDKLERLKAEMSKSRLRQNKKPL